MTTSPPTQVLSAQEELQALREVSARRIARIAAIAAWPLIVGAAYEAFSINLTGLAVFYIVAYLIVLLVAIFERRLSYSLQAGVVLLLAYSVAGAGLIQQGLASDARWFLILPPVLAGLFWGSRQSVVALLGALGMLLVFGALFSLGVLTPQTAPPETTVFGEWGLTALIYLALGGILLAAVHYLIPNLIQSWDRTSSLAQTLMAQQEDLQRQTLRSQKRARRFERAAELSRQLARVTDQEELQRRLPRVIAETFDLYQVNLYALDTRGERLLLVAVADEAAQKLLEQGYSLSLTEANAVAKAALLGAPEMQLVEGHPHFPESKALIALPVSVRGELLGVLEIHGRYEAFDEDDVYLFRILTDQVAALWASLRLVAETEARLTELRTLYARYAGVAWIELLRQLDVPAVHVGQLDTAAVEALKGEALARGEPRSALIGTQYVLLVPLLVRGVTLGFVALSRAAAQGDWPPETVALIRNAVERLAFALDNTRLLLESQRRALYEQQLSHVGEMVWSAADIEGVMEQGVAELGRLLGASEVALWLTSGKAS